MLKLDEMPRHYRERILKMFGRGYLEAGDFSGEILLRFEDQSIALFRYALYVDFPDLDEFAIFTEHCGYHVFPLEGTEVTFI